MLVFSFPVLFGAVIGTIVAIALGALILATIFINLGTPPLD